VANRQRFLLLKPNTKRVASTQLRLIAFGIERCDLKRREDPGTKKVKRLLSDAPRVRGYPQRQLTRIIPPHQTGRISIVPLGDFGRGHKIP
jgi:hypothetical protein